MAKASDQLPETAEVYSDAILPVIFNTAFDAIIIAGRTQKIEQFNPAAEQLLGFTNAEVRGKPLDLILPSFDVKELFSKKAHVILSTSARLKDGAFIPVEASAARSGTAGAFTYAITLRRQTPDDHILDEVHETRARLQAALASMNDAVFISDADGNFIEFNDAFATFHRFKNKEECAKTLSDYPAFIDVYLDNGEPAPLSQWAVPRALRGEIGSNVEYGLRRKDTGETWVGSYSFAPIRDKNDQIVGSVVIGRDITELKGSAQAVQRQKKNLQLFIEHAPAAIAMFDNQMRYIAASRRYLSDYGIEGQDVIGRSHYEIFPEITDNLKQIHSRALQGTSDFGEEDPFLRADGSMDWINWEIHPWLENAGEIGGVILFSEVITKRKIAQEELRNSEEKFSILFEKTPIPAMLSTFPEFRCVDANEAWTKLFGICKEDSIGKTFDEVGVVPDEAQSEQIIAQAQQRISVRNYEIAIRTKAGKSITTLTNIDVIIIGDKEFALTTMQDITERKRTEVAMKRYNQRLKNLHDIDQAILQAQRTPEAIAQSAIRSSINLIGCRQIGVTIFHPESKDVHSTLIAADGKIMRDEKKTLNADDFTSLTALGKGQKEIVDGIPGPDDPAAAFHFFEPGKNVYTKDITLQSEERIIGLIHFSWDRLDVIPPEAFEIADEISGQIAITIEQSNLRKKTAEHAAELEARVAERTAQLEDSNKDLEAFAYSVSHDLRAPLRSIEGFSQILQEDHAQNLDAEGLRVLDVIQNSAIKMDHLITDLLALSRVGRTQMNFFRINMTELVQSVYDEIVTLDDRKQITFQLSALPDTLVDPTLMHQVWTNLISNAIKYTQPKEDRRIEISGVREKGRCIYSIRDNGVGFNPKYQSNLFVLFQRLHKDSEFEGTGVGLTIVQRIIQRHGGRIWAEGEVGQGAVFHFALPRL